MPAAIRTFIAGHNYYVPAMAMAADLGIMLDQRLSLGAPIVANNTGILSAQSIAAAVDTTTFAAAYLPNAESTMGRYGRVLRVVASGAATSNVTVYGRDYLGQKIKESFTLNGTTPVIGKKAFKYVDRITAGITGGTTINVGFDTGFGLPYVTMAVEREYADGVLAAAGTLTAPVRTDPSTTTTGDPRGTYVPTTTPDGVKVIEMDVQYSNLVNASGNGGLMGIKGNGW